MRRTWGAVVVCLLLVPPAASGTEADRDIALLYVETAYDAYEEGRLDRARRLADVAREFAPESSDSLYLAALIAAENRRETRSAIELAGRAAERGAWRLFDQLHANVLRARLWNRVGEPEEADRILAETHLSPAMPADLRASSHFERARALDAMGREAERDGIVELAADRFPDDPRFFWFALRSEALPSMEYRRRLERFLDIDTRSSYGPDVDDLLFEYGMRAPVAKEAAWALEMLEEREWGEARIAELWLEVDPERALERFVELDGWSDYRTGRELLARLDEEAAERLLDRAKSFSGVSTIDNDRDGMWNERITADAGVIERWERDADQDGVAELDLELSGGEPASVRLASPGLPAVELEYEQYPFVSSARMSTEVGSEVFVLRPRSVRFETVVDLPASGPLFASDMALADAPRAIERSELVAASVRIDLQRDDETVFERVYREGGAAREILRDANGDGAWDHLILTDGGFATSGVRDLDNDGYFEVAEGYRNGRLVALAVDADGDGDPEVFEREVGVPVREWDLNGDGAIDVREFSWWTDSVIREFPVAEQRR
ncbi:MAG: tetratricopeptide repeat protein [Spirochaetota bacterium]